MHYNPTLLKKIKTSKKVNNFKQDVSDKCKLEENLTRKWWMFKALHWYNKNIVIVMSDFLVRILKEECLYMHPRK